jgi:2-oxoglutarate ferredoxin oxidoreductase subunit gamma
MKRRLIFAGAGGQGVLMMANLICYTAIESELNAVMSQTYGIEQRGGDCTGYVVLSDQPIGIPLVENNADICMIMNQSMLPVHTDAVRPGGIMILNSSLIKRSPHRKDINYIKVPATDLADKVGNSRCANMVAIGSLIENTRLMQMEVVLKALNKIMGDKNEVLYKMNHKALDIGIKWIQGISK